MSIENNIKLSTTTDEDEDEDEECTTAPPPDGGWGWMVVFGSFMIHIITDGVTYSFGVFYDEFLTYFAEGKAATAWILSILVGVTLCSGPISSSFVNRWGCRVVTIAGAIIASVSMIISVYAKNVTTLYFTVGIGTGFGFGLIYLPAIVSVTMYFEKKRSLATGIAVCGSGFGTFIFAPILTKLLTEYGWRGAMLIIAGIVLECILFGAMFRPLDVVNDEKICRKIQAQIDITEELEDEQQLGERTKLNLHSSDHNLQQHLKIVNEENNTTTIRPYSLSLSLTRNHKVPGSGDHRHGHHHHHYHQNGSRRSYEACRMTLSHPLLPQIVTTNVADRLHFGSQGLRRHYGPLDKPDIFYQGSLMNIPSYRSRLNLKHRGDDFELRSTSPYLENTKENRTTICGIIPCNEEARHTLKQMLDFTLFKDWIFILFTISNFLTSVGFNVPYVYIVPQAKTMGISAEQASMLLSIIGIANTVGRIVLGFFSDKPWVNRLMVYNLCLLIAGVATIFSSFCTTFVTLALYGSVFGFTIGAYVGLTSVILVDLLGLEKLTNAFGLLLLFQGIASLVGPPIAGALYDITLSYNPGFYLSGIAIALSGIVLFFIPLIKKKQPSIQITQVTNS